MVTAAAISVATASAHLFQIMAGASLRVYLRRLIVTQEAAATAAAVQRMRLFRLSTAGTGGTAITPAGYDPADAASGATSMVLPTVAGTTSTLLWAQNVYFLQTVSASLGPGTSPVLMDIDFDKLRQKPPVIAAGAANGLVLVNGSTAVAAGTVNITAIISEANF